MWYMIMALIFFFALGTFAGFEMGRQYGIQSVAKQTATLMMAQRVESLIEFMELLENADQERQSKKQ